MAGGWKGILAQVAPTVAKLLGGPMAGSVVKRLAKALLGDENAGEKEVEKAVLAADPAMFLKLREMETEYEKFVATNNLDLAKLEVDDRSSARSREINAKDSWTPRVLALAVFALFSSVIYMLYNTAIPEGNRDAANQVLGILYAAVSMVLGYYFGSSAGSARKDAVIGKMNSDKD